MTVETVYVSGSKPVLLKLNYLDPTAGNGNVIFKRGDDLRRDSLVHTLFAVFNRYYPHPSSLLF
jgi:hypothetical protein